jgi:hypothetical protein
MLSRYGGKKLPASLTTAINENKWSVQFQVLGACVYINLLGWLKYFKQSKSITLTLTFIPLLQGVTDGFNGSYLSIVLFVSM